MKRSVFWNDPPALDENKNNVNKYTHLLPSIFKILKFFQAFLIFMMFVLNISCKFNCELYFCVLSFNKEIKYTFSQPIKNIH